MFLPDYQLALFSLPLALGVYLVSTIIGYSGELGNATPAVIPSTSSVVVSYSLSDT